MNSAGTQLYMGSGGWCRFLSGREETHHHDPHFLSGQAKGSSPIWGRFYPDFTEAFGWDVGGSCDAATAPLKRRV